MGLRLVVVCAFLAAAATAGLIAYRTGMLPGPTQAGAVKIASPVFRVTTLAWPKHALGLTATDRMVLWEQRDPSPAVAGLWACDVRTRQPHRLLGRQATGKASGFPSASGDVVVWTDRRGAGDQSVEGYDTLSTRRWMVAEHGCGPDASGETLVWVEPHGSRSGGDAICGVDTVTDEAYVISTDERVRDVAASDGWAAWLSGGGASGAVWAGSYRRTTRHQLASAGTAVAIDRARVVWATPPGGDSAAAAIVSWNRRTKRSRELCRVAGAVSSLSVGSHFAVWVTKREEATPQVWVYDFRRGRAYPVSAHAGAQASPVVVAGSVFWAERRSGKWELLGRSPQP